MIKKTYDFIQQITTQIPEYKEQAQALIEDELKKDIKNLFNYKIISSSTFKDHVRARNKFELVRNIYDEEQEEFINEYWNEMDMIIDLLNEIINEKENENE